jgi:hypothetical protein
VIKKGLVCLLPAMAHEDDVICVLSGCRAPPVLRKNGDFFELLGECYVHGYMFGEAFKPIPKCDDTWKRVGQNAQQGMSRSPSIAAREEMSTKASKEQPHAVGENDLPPGLGVHDFDIDTGAPMFAYPDLDIETEYDPRISQEGGPLPAGWTSGYSGFDGPRRDLKPFFVNLGTGETTGKDPGVPLLENGSILGGFLIEYKRQAFDKIHGAAYSHDKLTEHSLPVSLL